MKETRPLVIGSRGSQLALWQAEWVRKQIAAASPQQSVEIVVIKTTGDLHTDPPLSKIGDKGLFTREIEHALLEHSIDLAVHSLKDLPTTLPFGLRIGAISKREDPRDVFIAHPSKKYRSIAELPVGATIATGSLRRTSQLLNWRPDIRIADLRGNIHTRLEKLDRSDWDGIILAGAGIHRLGLGHRITEKLSFQRMLPAVGQGALGIEVRSDDTRTRRIIGQLNSEATRIATSAERSLLHHLEGGCQVPIGALARIEKNALVLEAMIGTIDGKRIIRGSARGHIEDPQELGIKLADALLQGGGEEILRAIRQITVSEVATV